jgi:hypothetical protein
MRYCRQMAGKYSSAGIVSFHFLRKIRMLAPLPGVTSVLFTESFLSVLKDAGRGDAG